MKFRNAIIATVGSALLLASSLAGASAQVPPPPASGDAYVEIRQDNPVFTVSVTDADFGILQYMLIDQYPEGYLDITVTDTRGTGAGWNVSLDATDFTGGTSTPIEITNNLNLSPGEQIPVQSPAGDPAPLGGLTAYPATPVQETTVSSTKVWSAAIDSGEGEYTLRMEGNLRVPAGTLIGVYTSDVAVTLNSAP
jgi:hypothetical protein